MRQPPPARPRRPSASANPPSSSPASANLANVSSSGGADPTPITPAMKALLHITTNRGGITADDVLFLRLHHADRHGEASITP